MDRCKTILLTLALIAGLGLATGCDQDVKQTDEEKATAEAAKKEDDKKAEDEKPADPDQLPIEATGPVATVDGEPITAEEFNEVIEQRAGAMMGRGMPPRVANMMKQRTLDALINKRLLDKQLEKSDVTVSDEEVEEEFAEFKKRFPSEEQLQAFLKRSGKSLEDMKENVRKDLKLRKILTEKYGIEVSEADAQEYYEKNTDRFKQQEQVKASHILIKTEKGADEAALKKAEEKAQKIAKEAKKKGTDFAALAKEKSEGPSAQRGGDLGFFTKRRMVPEFADAAFKMKPGEISDPVKSQFGYHVIKVEDRKEAGQVPFEEAKDKIVDQLKRQKYRASMKKFLAEVKEGVEVKRNPDNIKVNATAPAKQPGMGGGGMGGAMGGQNLPPQIRKQLQQKIQQAQQKQQQQQKEGGEGSSDPTKLELKEPQLGK